MVMMCALLWELIVWMRSRGLGAVVEASHETHKADETMLGAMSPGLRKIIKKHMEIRR